MQKVKREDCNQELLKAKEEIKKTLKGNDEKLLQVDMSRTDLSKCTDKELEPLAEAWNDMLIDEAIYRAQPCQFDKKLDPRYFKEVKNKKR